MILGGNGVGKLIFFNIIVGILFLISGIICILGEDVIKFLLEKWVKYLFWVF